MTGHGFDSGVGTNYDAPHASGHGVPLDVVANPAAGAAVANTDGRGVATTTGTDVVPYWHGRSVAATAKDLPADRIQPAWWQTDWQADGRPAAPMAGGSAGVATVGWKEPKASHWWSPGRLATAVAAIVVATRPSGDVATGQPAASGQVANRPMAYASAEWRARRALTGGQPAIRGRTKTPLPPGPSGRGRAIEQGRQAPTGTWWRSGKEGKP